MFLKQKKDYLNEILFGSQIKFVHNSETIIEVTK